MKDTMLAPIRESETDETGFFMSLWLLDRAQAFPQAFKLLPVGSPRPAETGEWVTYPYTEKAGRSHWFKSSTAYHNSPKLQHNNHTKNRPGLRWD